MIKKDTERIRVAILSPIAWRTPPEKYGPWEQVASNITEGLIDRGVDVTLFATGNSHTSGRLQFASKTAYAEDKSIDPKVWECMHISNVMEQASSFDIIHNNFDFLPLSYSKLINTPMVTTIHGFSSQNIIPVYKKYNDNNFYVSISNSDRSSDLEYISTVYNGIDDKDFTYNPYPNDYLLFFGRIHPEKGTYESIQIAKKAKKKLIISGLIQDNNYFEEKVKPYLNDNDIIYVGNSGPKDRDKLLGGALALLHPISFNEPFGLSVAEAMMCGTPVVAFNKGSMSELIENTKTGFLVDNIDEAVESINKIGSINRKYCNHCAMSNFSIKRMIDGYMEVYHQVLDKTNRLNEQ